VLNGLLDPLVLILFNSITFSSSSDEEDEDFFLAFFARFYDRNPEASLLFFLPE
jgi:hypothetical protein